MATAPEPLHPHVPEWPRLAAAEQMPEPLRAVDVGGGGRGGQTSRGQDLFHRRDPPSSLVGDLAEKARGELVEGVEPGAWGCRGSRLALGRSGPGCGEL